MNNFYVEIAEAHQKLSYPLTETQVVQLGKLCRIHTGTRVLDLGCGKGELLNQWARVYEIQGTGVDESDSAIHQAMTRANELEVWSQVQFVVGDVLDFPQDYHQYHLVAHFNGLGAGIMPTLNLMRSALHDKQGGLLVVGESYWRRPPTDEVCAGLGVYPDTLLDLADLTDALTREGAELVDMLLIAPEQWDAYYTAQWRAVSAWLRENPDNPQADAMRDAMRYHRQNYLRYERETIGWGVFVLEVAGQVSTVTTSLPEKPLWED